MGCKKGLLDIAVERVVLWGCVRFCDVIFGDVWGWDLRYWKINGKGSLVGGCRDCMQCIVSEIVDGCGYTKENP